MKQIALLLSLMTVMSPLCAANLIDVYRAAVNHDVNIISAQDAYLAAQEKIPQAQSKQKLKVNLGANVTEYSSTLDNGLTRHGPLQGFTATAVQPLFHKENRILVEESKQTVAQAKDQFTTAQQDLALRTAQAYFSALQAADAICYVRAQKAALKEQLAQANRNYQIGVGTIININEVQARYEQALAQEIAANNQLEQAQEALTILTGQRYSWLAEPARSFPDLNPKPTTMSQWVAEALHQNLQIKMQQKALDLATLEIDRTRAVRYPTFDLVAGHTRDTGNLFSPFSIAKSDSLGVLMNLPIYEGGLISSQIREAATLRNKATADLEGVRRTVSLQARQAYLDVINGQAQVAALEQALVAAQNSLKSTQVAVRIGERTNVDLLNAQQQYYDALRNLSDARYNLLYNQLKLRYVASTLDEATLQQVNALLTQSVNVINEKG